MWNCTFAKRLWETGGLSGFLCDPSAINPLKSKVTSCWLYSKLFPDLCWMWVISLPEFQLWILSHQKVFILNNSNHVLNNNNKSITIVAACSLSCCPWSWCRGSLHHMQILCEKYILLLYETNQNNEKWINKWNALKPQHYTVNWIECDK